MPATRPFDDDYILSAIAEGLTQAELRGDTLNAARYRADLGAKLLLRGAVGAAQLHLMGARRVLEASGRHPDAARATALLHHTLWMSDADLDPRQRLAA